jgi:hypothetical protein
LAIPARDASKIIDAVPFLRDVAADARPVIGRRRQCTAAATPRWTRLGPPGGWAPRGHCSYDDPCELLDLKVPQQPESWLSRAR